MGKDAMESTKFNLWHYTTLDGLKGMLSSQTLWATDYRHLNDSSELTHSKFLLYQELFPKVKCIIENECEINIGAKKTTELHGGIESISKAETIETINILINGLINPPTPYAIPFILSFCKSLKNDASLQRNGLLSQWRGYGKDGGYAIIFDFEKFVTMLEIETASFYNGISLHESTVYNLEDLPTECDIKKHLDIITDFALHFYRARIQMETFPEINAENLGALFNCMMRLKHEGFKEECEYRFCTMSNLESFKETSYFQEDKNKCFKNILTRNNKGTIVPYIELFENLGNLPIERICIGPHLDKTTRIESTKVYLKSIGLNHIEVSCSEIPYIGFK